MFKIMPTAGAVCKAWKGPFLVHVKSVGAFGSGLCGTTNLAFTLGPWYVRFCLCPVVCFSLLARGVLLESLMVRPVGGGAAYRTDWYGGFGSRSVPLRYGDRRILMGSPFRCPFSRYRVSVQWPCGTLT